MGGGGLCVVLSRRVEYDPFLEYVDLWVGVSVGGGTDRIGSVL